MSRTDLTETQWQSLQPLLPADPEWGHSYCDHRKVLNGILWRLRTGAPWRDVPARYGPWQTCHARLVNWSREGLWQEILTRLQAQAEEAGRIDWAGAALDAGHVRAQRSACGARKAPARAETRAAVADEWLGCSRGGRTSKIHLCVDGHGRPLSVGVTAGQRADVSQLGALLDAIAVPRRGPGRPRKRPTRPRVDRAYGARAPRRAIQRRGIQCICPERQDARAHRLARGARGGRPPAFDAEAYKGRNVVERAINRLKDFRAIATRYDKRGQNFLAGILVATILMWLT